MSETIVMTGKSSVLENTFSPPIVLDPSKTHYIGLIDFNSYNSIPNVHAGNRYFHYLTEDFKPQTLIFPEGCYEIEAINDFLQANLGGGENIVLRANPSTLKCEIYSIYYIDFTKENSIGSLLGFSGESIPPKTLYEARSRVDIIKVNMICVECNIAYGSYLNGDMAHIIFAFSPNVPPGHKISLSPRTVLYSRINTTVVDRLRLSIVDQNGELVDFGGEEISVRLHIKSDL